MLVAYKMNKIKNTKLIGPLTLIGDKMTAPKSKVLTILSVAILCGAVWFVGVKPFLGEVEHFKYKQALGQRKREEALKHILQAIKHDPHNTAYLLYTGQLYAAIHHPEYALDYIERTIVDYNGDITAWSMWFIKGILKAQLGDLRGAKRAFEKALYYNPTFGPAKQKLAEVEGIMKAHDRVLVPIR